MLSNLANTSTSIYPGKILSSVFLKPQTLQIKQGCALLTIAGDINDYELSQGESMQLPADRLIVIEAMEAETNQELIAQFDEKSSSISSVNSTGKQFVARIDSLKNLFSRTSAA